MVKEAKKLQRAKMVELKKEEKKRQRLTAKTQKLDHGDLMRICLTEV